MQYVYSYCKWSFGRFCQLGLAAGDLSQLYIFLLCMNSQAQRQFVPDRIVACMKDPD